MALSRRGLLAAAGLATLDMAALSGSATAGICRRLARQRNCGRVVFAQNCAFTLSSSNCEGTKSFKTDDTLILYGNFPYGNLYTWTVGVYDNTYKFSWQINSVCYVAYLNEIDVGVHIPPQAHIAPRRGVFGSSGDLTITLTGSYFGSSCAAYLGNNGLPYPVQYADF